jgi:hypothetical protein
MFYSFFGNNDYFLDPNKVYEEYGYPEVEKGSWSGLIKNTPPSLLIELLKIIHSISHSIKIRGYCFLEVI